VRFFRPDKDERAEHFELDDVQLNSKTDIGEFSIDAIDLNRRALRSLRDIRRRLTRCDELVAEGVLALKRFHIDQLPPNIKKQAARTIRSAIKTASEAAEEIDYILTDYARSPLVDDEDVNPEEARQRAEQLADWKVLFPGNWRAPRGTRKGAPQKK
jgi:hypothetical protein